MDDLDGCGFAFRINRPVDDEVGVEEKNLGGSSATHIPFFASLNAFSGPSSRDILVAS